MTHGQDRTATMLATALEMEEKGRVFYAKATQTCRNPLGQEVFGMLMNEEVVHVDRIRLIHESVRGGAAWPEGWKHIGPDRKDLGRFFRELASRQASRVAAETSDLEAVEVGIAFEQKSVAFYQEHLAGATDPLERAFLERMVGEERAHHGALVDMKLYFVDPSSWFREVEKGGLDGA